MEILFELFGSLPRQGPGSDATTLRALSMISLPANPKILDVGCGSGGQTITLAKALNAEIIAVDVHQPFLDSLAEKSRTLTSGSRIITLNKSMSELDLPENSFDLIWSEGAVYNMGFENAVNYFRKFLKPGGYFALSEIAWFSDAPPDEIKAFWDIEYPDIMNVEKHLRIIEKSGFEIVGHFSLPDSDWWYDLYTPLQNRIEEMKEKYSGNEEALEFLKQTEYEIAMHKKYSAYYGYEFFILRK